MNLMYCPNQHCPHMEATGEPAQYRTGIAECVDCGSTLVETMPAWSTDAVEYEEFVPVLTLEGAAMVSFVQSLLQSAGIRFFIKNERVQDLFGIGRFGTGFSPITGAPMVFVEPTKVEEARELLAAMNDELEEDA
jgi:hypothetical protein